ncbi:STN1, CST complex subunit S homeolog isoform X2 [Xenopus laevis]|uniref:CST complex subunit STN1 n=1 Tax=Xenopus laevis TaxID=8355 RepID=A0A8J1LAG6_XENLA|nr:STN1, CST complex subunit S homeolog isoform X2 [Xenopus laevis]XP_041426524.1 STN1, CST complex subunit S homeolog isoform X2 [Xenopus laevis]
MEWTTVLESSAAHAGRARHRQKSLIKHFGWEENNVATISNWLFAHLYVSSETAARHIPSSSKDLDAMMKELYKEENKKAKMDIGDIIRVRGSIKVFREQREIVASVFYKVEDPTLDIQMARMLDLPYMYRNVYDEPFAIPDSFKNASEGKNDHGMVTQAHLITQLSEKVKVFLMENKIHNFYQRELESVDSLIAIASSPVSDCKAEPKDSSSSKQIHNIFKEAIKVLLEGGYIFQKGPNQEVYQVTDQDKDLHKRTLSIIQEDCKRQKHAEKGCHFLYILTCVRQSFGSSVRETVLRRVIDTLEGNSDIDFNFSCFRDFGYFGALGLGLSGFSAFLHFGCSGLQKRTHGFGALKGGPALSKVQSRVRDTCPPPDGNPAFSIWQKPSGCSNQPLHCPWPCSKQTFFLGAKKLLEAGKYEIFVSIMALSTKLPSLERCLQNLLNKDR